MILLLGASGYIGSAFKQELEKRGLKHKAASRNDTGYDRREHLLHLISTVRPTFVINAAGYTGTPNVDACEVKRRETFDGNVRFPVMLSQVCNEHGIPWGHVSSGCIYDGLLFEKTDKIVGYTESDEPNFSLLNPPCSWYSGTKEMAERLMRSPGMGYIWRPRMPFDGHEHPKNYITKLRTYPKAYMGMNSITHRGDFVKACLDLWRIKAPFGTYNMTNPGYVTTEDVTKLISKYIDPRRVFEFWESDEEFYAKAAKAPRSNCILDVSKLLKAGVDMRPIDEALHDTMKNWWRLNKAK